MSQHDVRRLGGVEYVEAPQPRMRPAPAVRHSPDQDRLAAVAAAFDGEVVRTESASAAADAARGEPWAGASEDEGVVVLSKPYQAHDEKVQRITLRKPLARDVRKCGYPLRPVLGDDGVTLKGYDILADVIVKYIPLLASPPLPASTVDQFEIADLNACSAVINGFFQR